MTPDDHSVPVCARCDMNATWEGDVEVGRLCMCSVSVLKILRLHLGKDLAVGQKLLQEIKSDNFKGNFNFGDLQFWFLAAGYTTGIAQSAFLVFLKLGYFIIWVKYFINKRQAHLFTQLLEIINTSG